MSTPQFIPIAPRCLQNPEVAGLARQVLEQWLRVAVAQVCGTRMPDRCELRATAACCAALLPLTALQAAGLHQNRAVQPSPCRALLISHTGRGAD